MHRNASLALRALAVFTLGTGTSHAMLIDRGGGLIYDDVLNLTWMQDASYAHTVGATVTGRMTYNEAMAFADEVSYYDNARDTNWDDWRLPNMVNDRSSVGYDLTGQSSELAYMYYINLGYAPDYDPVPSDPVPGSSNYNPFTNLVYLAYWSQTLGFREGSAWGFHFHFGFAGTTDVNDNSLAWLVRDGDVGPHNVPEPGTLLLMGAGLLAFCVTRQRKGLNPN